MAIALRDKANYVDLTGLARLRATIRTMSLHVIYPIVKLADGTYLAGSRGINTEGDFLQAEVLAVALVVGEEEELVLP